MTSIDPTGEIWQNGARSGFVALHTWIIRLQLPVKSASVVDEAVFYEAHAKSRRLEGSVQSYL